MESSSGGDQRVTLAFRERYWADVAEGAPRPLTDYIALWPEHEELVAREFLAAQDSTIGISAAPSENFQDRDRLGVYQIEKAIGRGGQGVVYKAIDTKLNRPVALKVLSGLGPNARAQMQRFRREVEVTSKLDHPGICSVFDAGIESGVPYIAMRFVDGETLAERLSSAKASGAATAGTWLEEMTATEEATLVDGASPEEGRGGGEPGAVSSMTRAEVSIALRLFEKVARALHAAHEAGVIHRDIKPGNIMVSRGGEPVVLDFGLARDDTDEEGPTLTRTGDIFGTPAYMSPEQVSGKMLQLDRRTDVYSLGATLYEFLTGVRPFEAPTREGLFQAILSQEPVDARRLNRTIPQDLKVVLDAALEKDRDKRYASAEALAEDLAAIREHRPIAAKPIGAMGRMLRWSRRHPARAALLGAFIVGMPLVTYLVGTIVANRPKIEAQERAALMKKVERLVARGFYELHHVAPQRARASFARAREMLPRSGEAIGGEALALLSLGKPEAALKALSSAPDGLPELRRIERRVLRTLGREAEAEALEATLDEMPATPFGLFLVAQENMTIAHAGHLRGEAEQKALRRALQAFERAISYSPTARLVHYIGFTHAVMHLPEEVHTQPLVEGLTANWPDSATAWLWTGDVANAKGDHEKELACYARAEALDPEVDTILRRSNALGDMGRHEEALDLARQALERYPENDDNLGYIAVLLNNLERFDEAIEVCEQLLERAPQDVTAHIALTHALRRKGRMEEALKTGAQGVALAPFSASMLCQHAWSLHVVNRDEESLALWRRLMATGRDIRDMHRGMGRTLNTLGRYAEAVPVLERAAELDPESAPPWTSLGTALWGVGRFDEAEKVTLKSLALEPEEAVVWTNLASIRLDKNDARGAIEALEKALTLTPEDGDALGLMGHCLARLDRNEAAVEYWARSLKPRPAHLETRVNLATTLMEMGRMDEAREHFLYAAALDLPVEKKNSVPFYGIASGLSAMGRTDEARACYRKSIASNPSFAEAYCNLSVLEQSSGNLDEAIKLLRRGHAEGTKRKQWPYPSKDWLLDALTLRFNEVRRNEPQRAAALAAEILEYRPDDVMALVALAAWRVDPAAPETERDVAAAVALAVRATTLTQRKDPLPLHTLALALFESGNTAAAIPVQEEALALMRGRNRRHLDLDEVTDQLERFRKAATGGG